VRVYPGCGPTLAACLTNAPGGTTVRLRTNGGNGPDRAEGGAGNDRLDLLDGVGHDRALGGRGLDDVCLTDPGRRSQLLLVALCGNRPAARLGA
jgi:hypothetical protein